MSDIPHPVTVLRGHQGEVQALTFIHDETLLISGDSLGEVRFWNLLDFRPQTTQNLHPVDSGVLNLQLYYRHSDGQFSKNPTLITQGRDGTTCLWTYDTENKLLASEPIHTFSRQSYSFCRFSLLAPQQPTSPLNHDCNDKHGEKERKKDEFVNSVLSCDAPTDAIDQENNNRIDSSTKSGRKKDFEKIADAIRRVHSCSLEGNPGAVPALLAIPSNNEKVIEVCCCECGHKLAHFYMKSDFNKDSEQPMDNGSLYKYGMCLAVKLFLRNIKESPDDTGNAYEVCIAIGYENGSVVVFPVSHPQSPLAEGKLHNEPIMALAIDNETGQWGVSGSAEDKVVCFDIEYDQRKIICRNVIDVRRQGVGDIAVRPDGKIIAVAGWDGRARIYRRKTCNTLAVLKYHVAAASSICFSPETYLIATGSRDGTVALWDTYSQKAK